MGFTLRFIKRYKNLLPRGDPSPGAAVIHNEGLVHVPVSFSDITVGWLRFPTAWGFPFLLEKELLPSPDPECFQQASLSDPKVEKGYFAGQHKPTDFMGWMKLVQGLFAGHLVR